MHPFCCISAVSDHNPSPHNPFADNLFTMPPPPSANVTASTRPDPPVRSTTVQANHHHHNHSNGNNGNNSNHIEPRLSQRAEPVDVKINDIVGNGISGVLYKWVNYGKGWRPRWFVLQDGVLSYYKIHGPDKIVVSEETEKGCKVIGEESTRIISKRKHKKETTSQRLLNRKPFGEVHLKVRIWLFINKTSHFFYFKHLLYWILQVSSIRDSKSDDKRFSIFTGTKRLHLRAETREDRFAWMEALQAVKDMFPRMSNSELMAPMDSIQVSTEKLRQLLSEEGVREEVIQESEQIMRNEFAPLQSQLLLLKQKQWLLIDTLRQLEVHLVQTRNQIRNSICSDSPTVAKWFLLKFKLVN